MLSHGGEGGGLGGSADMSYAYASGDGPGDRYASCYQVIDPVMICLCGQERMSHLVELTHDLICVFQKSIAPVLMS